MVEILSAINTCVNRNFKSVLQFARFLYDNYYEYLNIHDENGKKNFDKNATYTGAKNNDYRFAIDIVRKKVTKDLAALDCRNSEYLYAYCLCFGCSADYLLDFIDLPTHADTDIYKETGLAKESIQTLREIQKSDKNENTMTILPKNLYEKLIKKEPMTQDEKNEFEKIFFNPSEENLKPYSGNRPKLMDLLNFMLKQNYYMENLLGAFRNFINPFTVPVFFDNKNGWTFPNNRWSKDVDFHGNVTYTINLASDEEHPEKNFPIWVDKNFLDSIYIKSIDRIFQDFRDEYYIKMSNQ